MFTLGSSLKFHLYSQPTDMRKSFDSLSGLVQNELGLSPISGDVYVFINKTRNKIKLLHWAGSGFVLYYKRLESGTFEHLKYDIQSGSYSLSYSQIVMLVDGISIKNIDFKTRKRYRQLYAKPVLDHIQKKLKEYISQVLPKSAIGKAVSYTLKLWPQLYEYTSDGKYELDNNLIENAIRPLALGRKNYLFAGSHKAAQRAAMFYSFFATCKINDTEPLAWLTDVLERIPEHKANKLSELLPQNWEPLSTNKPSN